MRFLHELVTRDGPLPNSYAAPGYILLSLNYGKVRRHCDAFAFRSSAPRSHGSKIIETQIVQI
jgi:hypothetical protein